MFYQSEAGLAPTNELEPPSFPEHVVAELKAELQKPIQHTQQLVYLATQLRKLIDGHKRPPDYSALQLFLSWPLHTKLDRGWAQKPLDSFHANCETLLGWKTATAEQDDEFAGILAFSEAHDQLLDLLRVARLGVYSRLFQPSGWEEFIKFYLEAVRSTPLVIAAKPTTASVACAARFGADACLEEVTIAMGEYKQLFGGSSVLRINWQFRLKNGTTKVVTGGITFAPDCPFVFGRRCVPPNDRAG